jgi:hypothetical protein
MPANHLKLASNFRASQLMGQFQKIYHVSEEIGVNQIYVHVMTFTNKLSYNHISISKINNNNNKNTPKGNVTN